MAFVFASEGAAHATDRSLHYHGGYGFSEEYDIQLYYRRARGWSLVARRPDDASACDLADRLFGPVARADRWTSHSPPRTSRSYRDEVRSIIADDGDPRGDRPHAHHRHRSTAPELNRALGGAGFARAAGPRARARAIPIELWMLFNELEKAGAPVDGLGVAAHDRRRRLRTSAPTGRRRTIIPGDPHRGVDVCMGYSEPDDGSDVAAVTTKAVRDGDEWVDQRREDVDHDGPRGQRGHPAHPHRTPRCPSTRASPCSSCPMDTPGHLGRPRCTPWATERTNVTFYDDVRVGDDCRVGEVDGGWKHDDVALVFERGVMGGTDAGASRCCATSTRGPRRSPASIDDPIVRERLARVAIDNEVVDPAHASARPGSRRPAACPGSRARWPSCSPPRHYQRAAERLSARWPGPRACSVPRAGRGRRRLDRVRPTATTPVTTIYGGTSEINRNIIAERHLGLPKARR